MLRNGLIEPEYWCLKCETKNCFVPGVCRDCSAHEFLKSCMRCGSKNDILATDGVCISCHQKNRGLE